MNLPFPRAARHRPPYKLLSVLLQYPDEALLAAQEELAAAVAALPRSPASEAVGRFWRAWCDTPALERAQRYVATFDLHKRTSLYLTFYLHGDTRQRGMALLRLKRLYRAAGLPLAARELPDYLPVLLEFAALASPGRGEALLEEQRPGLELLRAALREQGSPYQHLLDAACSGLGAPTPADLARLRELAVEGPPREQVGLEPFAPPKVMPSAEVRP